MKEVTDGSSTSSAESSHNKDKAKAAVRAIPIRRIIFIDIGEPPWQCLRLIGTENYTTYLLL